MMDGKGLTWTLLTPPQFTAAKVLSIQKNYIADHIRT